MPDRDELVFEAWSALKGASWGVFSRFSRLEEDGVASPAQMGVLHVLLADGGTLTSRELAQRLDVTPATVTGALNALEKAGYVRRKRDAKDRRVVHVSVTTQGKSAAKRRRERMREHLREVLAPLDDKELRTLTALLSRVAPPIHGPPGGFGALLRRDSGSTRR